mmetsp:Transcript_3624/g.4157  ORF Transcript_3624/g.4157 Transcript_3624/m.4157 type:complete len:223 (+) Transcript_3624:706-1374(+)
MRVDDRAGEVISGVSLEAVSSAMVRDVLSAVENGITQALDFVLHVQFGTDAEVGLVAGEHALEELQIFLDCVGACSGLNAGISLLLHLLSGQVVSVSLAIRDELAHVVLDHLEVVGTVGDLVRGDAQDLEIADDVVHEFNLLVHGVGVVKAQDHLALVHARVVIVHHSGLDVTDMEVTRGLGREARDYLAIDGVLEHALRLRVVARGELGGFDHLIFLCRVY